MARANEPRGLRDEANVGPDPRRARNLIPMRELKDLQIADGEPDIRGWRVYSSTGREVGLVEDLLVDTTAGEVVMLDIDLRRNDRHTLVPIRAAWIDRTTQRVVIDSSELDTDDALPTLPRGGAVSDDDLRAFDDRYQRAYGDRGYQADREYRIRRENDELRFGRRSADPGAPAAGAGGAVAADSAAPPSDPRSMDRDADARDAGARSVPADRAVEPDVLDAQTRADIPVHPHGDRYLVSERVVERHQRPAEEAPVDALNPGDTTDRRVRYPASAQDVNDERRRSVLEEVVVRRREVDPSELKDRP